MKRITLFVFVALVGCNNDPSNPAADMAHEVCAAFCDTCGGADGCADTCFGQWETFGYYTDGKADCADEYLAGVICQAEHVDEYPDCKDPACGNPYETMFQCAADK